ncbi:chitooligosaccharidolytic beta-N-acetylglucosaminidase [Copidosoma floridanum]|uniref:chitooligosaccharidolytic beta-N-acetylglucosaminidase n=1 Tax=Copidosoma floridanum TaxID=29053 RepID=UPI0006C990B0|nr:chitooligosaccharidolytic beta-N-acetylglucosaminidase [Copidosoma floridanum]
MFGLFVLVLLVRFFTTDAGDDVTFSSPYHYYCEQGFCKKTEITANVTTPLALSVCQLFCGEALSLWPKPTGHVSVDNVAINLDPDSITLSGVDSHSQVGQLLRENVERLRRNVKRLAPGAKGTGGAHGLTVRVIGKFDLRKASLTLDTPENYTLKVYQDNEHQRQLIAEIDSSSYFGARHALETLSQLIVHDDLYDNFKIPGGVLIKDGPAYPYRGILLDTARNFMDKPSILRTIDAMAMSKMNTFHWHITDSQSFPYVSRSLPKMSKYGAYAPSKVYTEEDVKEIVRFGLLRGVRILPEFDAPAHVGEGWQWVGHNATVCLKAKPWQDYCVEPPCGQLNPTSDKVYEILESIFTDMLRDFQPDFFHMGGDEVNINCWNSSDAIRDWMADQGWDASESSFYRLWGHFQARAYEKLAKANGGKELGAVLWTSGLTSEENLLKYLDPKKYIVQIWTTGADATIGRLIKNKFRIILSNYDALYMDCGFGAWVGEGNNWCSPYIGWQKVYENAPMKILQNQGFSREQKPLVLGGEAALWSEQVDSTSVDSRLWPRSAALAERLWSDPSSPWNHAEQRMLRHRQRLVQHGVYADSLEPEWCMQNQNHCFL